ncbi:MAG TPA: amidohydrolase family protein [Planctomycetota bacterium]|nr:amidohydrolase family protein [Planctomycetota bacterium]
MFDLVLRGAVVHDGSATPVREDVAVLAGKIAARAPDLSAAETRETIDASGLALLPGFVDVHTHYDLALGWEGLTDHALRQGITTVVGGNCGIGEADVPAVLERAHDARLGIHVGLLASHGPLRSRVVPREEGRGATELEARAIGGEVARALDAGALGLSWGPYHENALASQDELVAAASELASRGKPFVVHRRDEGANALPATEEALEIARRAGCALQVSHLKIAGRANWNRFDDLLAILERARRGQDVTTDVYPYDGSLTYLNAVLPSSLKADGRLLERLATETGRAEARAAIHRWFTERQPAEKVVLVAPVHAAAPRGGTLTEAARAFGLDDPAEAALRIIEVDGLGGWATYRDMMKLEHVETALELEGCAIASDSVPEDDGRPAAHPRCYGTFARALALARARGRFDDAVARATRIPAKRFGLDRGTLDVDAPADMVVLDPARLRDAASYAEPDRYPEGIVHVLVRGVVALRDGAPTGARAGEVLRR